MNAEKRNDDDEEGGEAAMREKSKVGWSVGGKKQILLKDF